MGPHDAVLSRPHWARGRMSCTGPKVTVLGSEVASVREMLEASLLCPPSSPVVAFASLRYAWRLAQDTPVAMTRSHTKTTYLVKFVKVAIKLQIKVEIKLQVQVIGQGVWNV